jgi:hypothetical protein
VKPPDAAHRMGYVAAVLLLPVLVLWSQDNALFTGYGYIEPWVYFGYFRNLVEFKRNLFPGNPLGAQLSWLLPGAAFHTLFAPVTATRLLHLGVHSLASMSLFLTLKWAAGARRAFVAAMVFSVNPWWWAAAGWDYVDGIGIAYSLLTMALLTWAALVPQRRVALIAAGMALAALLLTGAGWLALAPLLPLYYVGLMRAWHQIPFERSVLTLCVWFGTGCAAGGLGFGVINYFLDGRLLPESLASRGWLAAAAVAALASVVVWHKIARRIFMLALSSMLVLCVFAWIAYAAILPGSGSPAARLEGLWSQQAPSPWLLFPILAVAAALAILFSERRNAGREISVRVLFALQLLCAFGWMAYAQMRGRPELGQIQYASKLLPFSFLVIGAGFWPDVEKVPKRDYLLFCCAAAAVLGYAWLGEGAQMAAHLAYAPWIGAAALLASLFGLRLPEYLICSLGGFFLFTALGVGARFGGIDAHAFRDQLQALSDARERIESNRRGKLVRFWYNEKDPAPANAVALAATYLDEESLLNRSSSKPSCNTDLLPPELLASIEAKSTAPDFVTSTLSGCWSENGLRAISVEKDAVGRGSASYEMALLRVEAAPGAWRPMLPEFQPHSPGILREAPTASSPPEFPLQDWALPAGKEMLGELHAAPAGLILRTRAGPDSVAAVFPAMTVPVAGRYRFALRYSPRAGAVVFAVRLQNGGSWLLSATRPAWTGSDYEMTCWVDLAGKQEFELALIDKSDARRPASLLLKSLTAVRIANAP